jgi:AbrB family looped-hinge helix DNA binding protein
MVKPVKYTSTVTEKGMITLPVDIRRKYSIKRGSKVKLMEVEKGILIVPIPKLEDLFGIDPSMRKVAKAISEGRREEIQHETAE